MSEQDLDKTDVQEERMEKKHIIGLSTGFKWMIGGFGTVVISLVSAVYFGIYDNVSRNQEMLIRIDSTKPGKDIMDAKFVNLDSQMLRLRKDMSKEHEKLRADMKHDHYVLKTEIINAINSDHTLENQEANADQSREEDTNKDIRGGGE